jgi:outer membrane receptor for ferrienterochelin and colicins
VVNHDVARAQWTTLEGRVLWRGLLNHQLMLGAELRTAPQGVQRNYDEQPYSATLDSRVTQDSAAVYAQDQWRLSSALHLTTGLRVDRVRGFSAAASPRAVLAFRPHERESYKLMWAQSFRTPNLYERFYEDGGVSQLSNTSLKPERLNSAEVAWERLLPAGLGLSANAYYTRMNRLIELVPLGNAPDAVVQYRNVGRVTLRGVDLAVEQRSTGGWLWRASTSWMQARNDQGRRLSNAPSWMVKGHAISPQWQRWQLGAEFNLLGARSGRVPVPATAIVNAHLRRVIDARHSLALHVNNALDRRNLDPGTPDNLLSSIPQPGRAWRVDWRFTL